MSKVDIEKLIYKKPDLNLSLSFLKGARIHYESDPPVGDEEEEDIPWTPIPDPTINDDNPSDGTGGQ